MIDRFVTYAVSRIDARGTDERLPRDVLPVAGLLTDEHDLRAPAALAEHLLGRVLPQAARRAVRGGLTPCA